MSKKISSFANFGWKGKNFDRGNFIENSLTRENNSNWSSCTLLLSVILMNRGCCVNFWSKLKEGSFSETGSRSAQMISITVFRHFPNLLFLFFYHSTALVKVMPLKTNLSSLFTSMGFRFAQGVIRAESMSFCESN